MCSKGKIWNVWTNRVFQNEWEHDFSLCVKVPHCIFLFLWKKTSEINRYNNRHRSCLQILSGSFALSSQKWEKLQTLKITFAQQKSLLIALRRDERTIKAEILTQNMKPLSNHSVEVPGKSFSCHPNVALLFCLLPAMHCCQLRRHWLQEVGCAYLNGYHCGDKDRLCGRCGVKQQRKLHTSDELYVECRFTSVPPVLLAHTCTFFCEVTLSL